MLAGWFQEDTNQKVYIIDWQSTVFRKEIPGKLLR